MIGLLLLLAANDAETYAREVGQINEAHARKPGDATEDELGKRLSKRAEAALKRVCKGDDADALMRCGEAALDLTRMDHFDAVRKRLAEVAPDKTRDLGCALARKRYLLRGVGGLDERYLKDFARVLDAVLEAYDETFGFSEWSKVPGKKLRVRLRLVEKITRPPHFAPQYPWHSEIDFPVPDAQGFRSPSPDGKFLFYGICHELGHVIAMWGDRDTEEDHHAWAHYTGVVIVEKLKDDARVKGLNDVRWRSLEKERDKTRDPGLQSYDGVMALLIRLHDAVGPRAIGAAINEMQPERLNRVRYYRMADFRDALLRRANPDARRALAELFR